MKHPQFESWLIRNGKTIRTIERHRTNLAVLLRSIKIWKLSEIDQFLVDKKVSGVSHNTLNSYIGTIRLFANYSNLDKDLLALKFFKPNPKIRGTLSDEEIELICNMPPPKGSNKMMWATWSEWLWLLSLSGCRPAEISALTPELVDFGRGIIIIEKSKTGKPRFVPIPHVVKEALEKRVKSTRQGDFLYKTTTGRKFTDESWLRAFHKRREMAGIHRENVTPYSMRHSYITRLLEEDVNIHKIAKLVGHSVEQTATYEHLTTKDLQLAVKKHPLARKSSSTDEVLNSLLETIRNFGIENDSRFTVSIDKNFDTLKVDIRRNDNV